MSDNQKIFLEILFDMRLKDYFARSTAYAALAQRRNQGVKGIILHLPFAKYPTQATWCMFFICIAL